MRTLIKGAVGVVSALLALGTVGVGTAVAVPPPMQVYVSAGQSCGSPSYTTIAAGVAAVASGGTVTVCPGTYNEDVVVSGSVHLVGQDATVNPSSPVLQTNSPVYTQAGNNAFTVMGGWVSIDGFTVTGATGDGIFSAGDHTTVTHVDAMGNAATGISLNGSSWSMVADNTVTQNGGGGIYLTNDAGAIIPGATASHDQVVHNMVMDNPGGCGVILADHLGSTVQGAQGIFANLIRGNVVKGNGTGSGDQGEGGGVLLATEAPGGGVYDNVVRHNHISGNGLAGVVVHSHMSGQNFWGNVVVGNTIGRNNVGGDYADPSTTAVYVGSVDPVSISVGDNFLHHDHFGIFTAGPVTVRARFTNAFSQVDTRFGSTSVYAG
ncbi:MAG: right-handed parallel beta-helix repeat-containing protein [Actinomycetota bacterium]